MPYKDVFPDIIITRPNSKKLEQQWKDVLSWLQTAENFDEVCSSIEKIDSLRNDYLSTAAVVEIRHTMDTGDEFYSGEQDFFDSFQPRFEALMLAFYRAVTASKFRDELTNKYGNQFIAIAEKQSNTLSAEIIPLLEKENKLSSMYTRLMASARIDNPQYDAEGQSPEQKKKTLTLADVSRKANSEERKTRARYTALRGKYIHDNQKQLDDLFGNLVSTRTEIARELGYKTFTELGYNRMKRTSYTPDMLDTFRAGVREHFVPLVGKIRRKQRGILNIPEVMVYDEEIPFSGKPLSIPGNEQWLIETFGKIFAELSPETDAFFREIVDRQFYDLAIRQGKMTGAYSNYIPDQKFPFVFMTYNNTARAIRTLTHECGHGFQSYLCRELKLFEHFQPTSDIAELHSMSMEFMIWPFIDRLFGEDAGIYRENHLLQIAGFIPYGTAIDDFQHRVYKASGESGKTYRSLWKKLESEYLPDRKYGNIAAYREGGFWHHQTHVFKWPFYYIDYVLAQVCALQVWELSHRDFSGAWDKYMKLCRAGGTRSFLDVLEYAGLESPFKSDTLGKVAELISEQLQLG